MTLTKTKSKSNIRISDSSWEKLRWAKLKTSSKSYSDLIVLLDQNITLENSTKLKNLIRYYYTDELKEKVNSKTKTIMVNFQAHKILDKIKIMSNDASFTLSDSIYFLIFVNSL